MKTYKKLFISFLMVGISLAFFGMAHAMAPSFYLSSLGGDSVNISVTGDANSNIILYYNLNSVIQTRTLGITNNIGTFSTVISTSSYGITPGSSAYVLVNNQQSSFSVWPTYSSSSTYNSLSLSQTSLSLAVGQTSTVTAYNSYNYGSLYVSSNSNQSVATAYASGNSISISGVNNGSTTLIICQNGNTSSCGTVYVTVTGFISTNNSSSGLNISGLSLSVGNSVTISSAAATGLYVSGNTNPGIISVSYTSSSVLGCTATSNYSVITGQLCNNNGVYNGGYYSSILGCTATSN